jgi:hypothetical protein
LPNYQVVDTDMADVIETEAEPVDNVRELPVTAGE